MPASNVIRHINDAWLSRSSQREQLDLLKRMNELHLERRGGRDNPLEARIESLEMAFRMQTEAQQVFDLKQATVAITTIMDSRCGWPAAA